jgi:hypothetical protein
MAEHARSNSYETLRTAPDMKIGQVKVFFKNAGAASVVPMDVSATPLGEFKLVMGVLVR